MGPESGKIGVTPLGSGSGGNAFVVHAGTDAFLVDAGFSRRELCRRMEDAGVDPAAIRAVLVTHEHGDHVAGLRVFCNAFRIPAYLSSNTAGWLRQKRQLPDSFYEFLPGAAFELGAASILPFPVSHDAVEPVGFQITVAGVRIALATDLGELNLLAQSRLADADILVLEANYDLSMLLASDRSPNLKHRIMGRSGHLDNRGSLEALSMLLTPRTKALLLAHVSRECNNREMLAGLLEQRLEELGRKDLYHRVLTQEYTDEAFCLGPCRQEEKTGRSV